MKKADGWVPLVRGVTWCPSPLVATEQQGRWQGQHGGLPGPWLGGGAQEGGRSPGAAGPPVPRLPAPLHRPERPPRSRATVSRRTASPWPCAGPCDPRSVTPTRPNSSPSGASALRHRPSTPGCARSPRATRTPRGPPATPRGVAGVSTRPPPRSPASPSRASAPATGTARWSMAMSVRGARRRARRPACAAPSRRQGSSRARGRPMAPLHTRRHSPPPARPLRPRRGRGAAAHRTRPPAPQRAAAPDARLQDPDRCPGAVRRARLPAHPAGRLRRSRATGRGRGYRVAATGGSGPGPP
jgi:hypothetical protein